MTPSQRKAAFKYAVELNGTTCKAASLEVIGVTWDHLSQGLQNLRPLSAEVQQKFAEYIGQPVKKVFPARKPATVAA